MLFEAKSLKVARDRKISLYGQRGPSLSVTECSHCIQKLSSDFTALIKIGLHQPSWIIALSVDYIMENNFT